MSVGLLVLITPLQLQADDKPVVFVSVLPQKYLLNRVAGDLIDVQVMVRPGFSPATYEPSPRQILALSRADLYFRSGVPFEMAWMSRIRGVNPKMKVVDARSGIELRKLEAHNHDFDPDSHEKISSPGMKVANADFRSNLFVGNRKGLDPHIWTSPRIALRMAEQIHQELSELYPQHQPLFMSNHEGLRQELETLDQELSELFVDSPKRRFMVFHPSWGYFADAYGLTQIPIESDGKEPGAKSLTALIKQARTEGVKTIFVQPQFDQRIAKQVARAIGGNVVAIDPLAENYPENLRRVAHAIAGIADG